MNDNVTRECDGVRMVYYKKMKDEDNHRTFVRPYDEFFGEAQPGVLRFEPIISAKDIP